MTTLGALETLARILTLRVDLRDEKACAEISPEMAERYLRARGWLPAGTEQNFAHWHLGERFRAVPRHHGAADYGRRMVFAIAEIADVEQRSPLAVWVDMMAQKETAA